MSTRTKVIIFSLIAIIIAIAIFKGISSAKTTTTTTTVAGTTVKTNGIGDLLKSFTAFF